MPSGLLASLMRIDPSRRMMLVGYAADGFPIYGPESPESPGPRNQWTG
ncbi:MAG: YHYH protein [Planctomycetaceae bacterium]|nr:YHYH protein [Planctomycetaceae bacterium]